MGNRGVRVTEREGGMLSAARPVRGTEPRTQPAANAHDRPWNGHGECRVSARLDEGDFKHPRKQFMTTRRNFIRIVPLAGMATLAASVLQAQAQAPMLDEKDPKAMALGYVADAKRADKAKFPKYAEGQHCAVCQLYAGAATAPMAPCAIFAGKQVAGPGWCSAFVKKA